MELYLYHHGVALAPAGADGRRPLPPPLQQRISATPNPSVLNGERVPSNLPNGIRPLPRITARSTVVPPSLELGVTSL